MSDEQAGGSRGNVLREEITAPAKARRTARRFGYSRTSNLSSGVRQQQVARDPIAIDKSALYAFPVPTLGLLQECFKLTQAESRLAQFMARAETIEDAACALGIKLCTARTQLAAIFEKTATARQAELVALLSRLAHLGQSSAGQANSAQRSAQN